MATTTAANAAVNPLSAAAAGVSTVYEENTSSSPSPPPPWWQFHRRLSLPTVVVRVADSAGTHDDYNRGTGFDTIDWGDGNDNEIGSFYDDDDNNNNNINYGEEEYDDDDSLPLFDKEPPPPPRDRKLLIDFGPRRNNLAVRKISSIVTDNHDDDDETVNMEASTPATRGDDSAGHRQLSPEEGSLQEELQNCEDSSKYIYLVNNEDGGNCSNENSNGMTTLGRDDDNNSDDDGGTDNKGCRRKTPQPSPRTIREESDIDKSTSFHGLGLDDSNYDDECLVNYSFDETGDDAKHDKYYDRKNQGNIVKADIEPTTTRPAFHTSKSMEIHDSIWNLSSSGLGHEHEQETDVRDVLKGDNSTGTEAPKVETSNADDVHVFVPTPSLLPKLDNFDDVSSIGSSIHSGHVLRKEKTHNRLSFMKTPPFGFFGGQRTHRPPWAGDHASEDVLSKRSVTHEHDVVITEHYVFDDIHSKEECTTTSNQSWRKRQKQPKRRQSFVASLKSTMAWSSNHKTMDQSSSDELCNDVDEYDWDDYDDRYLEEEFFAAKDATNEAIVKDACEVMTTVNKSAAAMGIEPPFFPVVEVCVLCNLTYDLLNYDVLTNDRDILKTFPPCKELHSIIGYQMQVLKAVIGNPQGMMKRKSHRESKAVKAPFLSSSVCSDPQMMSDRRRLSAYIKDQMSMMDPFSKSQELLDSSANSSSCYPYLVHMYTSYLPNYMWYQPVASDATTTMRPTSLCSGTGITGKSQYLQPDMLHVFRMFGSYLVGSGHLFRDDDDDDDQDINNKRNIHIRRSAFWPDIPEDEDESVSSYVEYMASDTSSSRFQFSRFPIDAAK